MTNKFAVVGSPIEHSLSPALHGAAFKHLGLDWQYSRSLVEQGSLAQFLSSSELSGVSVTMPLKIEAFNLGVSRDEASTLTGVSNCLVASSLGWVASNTDVYGISKALAKINTAERIVIIGSGATAKSAVAALSKVFPDAKVEIAGRSAEKSSEIANFAISLGLHAAVAEIDAASMVSADLVMSLVPAGAFDQLWQDLSETQHLRSGWLFDVSYNPWPSVAAMAWDSKLVISGLEMLIWQAVKQVELFSTSLSASVAIDEDELYSVMKAAVSSK